MIKITFEKTEEPQKYNRKVLVPPNQEVYEEGIRIPVDLHIKQKTYLWEEDFHQLSPDKLVEIGKALAELALGTGGIKKFLDFKRKMGRCSIRLVESTKAPEIASIPWELIYIDDEFVSLNPRTPVIRGIEYKAVVSNLTLNKPIKMALICAMPPDQRQLMIETEQIRFALSIGHLVNRGEYDILYYTGHGTYQDSMGYLCLEKEEKSRGI